LVSSSSLQDQQVRGRTVSVAASRHAAAGLIPTNCRPQVLIAAISVRAIRELK